jgi:hypothetical protein
MSSETRTADCAAAYRLLIRRLLRRWGFFEPANLRREIRRTMTGARPGLLARVISEMEAAGEIQQDAPGVFVFSPRGVLNA